jgi:hypothetical protein
MSREELPRISELIDSLNDRVSSDTYFQNFENSIADERSAKRKHFVHIEAELAGLDLASWNHLKKKVGPLFEQRHRNRGWQPAFDKLNEAKAYNYLVGLGCSRVEFIPESAEPGQKTPDLRGRLGTTRVLCEVKTINPSDDEAKARGQMIARSIQGCLPDGFFHKLTSTLMRAKNQMDTHCQYDGIRRIVYVIINFDDNMHEYVEDYLGQLQEFVVGFLLPTVDIVFDVKPKFYSATSTSLPSRLFLCSMDAPWVFDGYLKCFGLDAASDEISEPMKVIGSANLFP